MYLWTTDRSYWDWTILSPVLLLYRELPPFQQHPRLLLRVSGEDGDPRLERWGGNEHHRCKLSLVRHAAFTRAPSPSAFLLAVDDVRCTCYYVLKQKRHAVAFVSRLSYCTQFKWYMHVRCTLVHSRFDSKPFAEPAYTSVRTNSCLVTSPVSVCSDCSYRCDQWCCFVLWKLETCRHAFIFLYLKNYWC